MLYSVHANGRNTIITEWSEDDSVIRQDEIVEGAFCRNGLSCAAVNKEKAYSGECLLCKIEVDHVSSIVFDIVTTGWSDIGSESPTSDGKRTPNRTLQDQLRKHAQEQEQKQLRGSVMEKKVYSGECLLCEIIVFHNTVQHCYYRLV